MTVAIDPERLRRGLRLDADRQDDGTWRVAGHRVDAEGRCDCADATFRPSICCKHRIAAMLSGLDPDLLAALRVLVPTTTRTTAGGRPR